MALSVFAEHWHNQKTYPLSVCLLRGVGLERTADHLLKFGFLNSDINRSESLAFGSASITLPNLHAV